MSTTLSRVFFRECTVSVRCAPPSIRARTRRSWQSTRTLLARCYHDDRQPQLLKEVAKYFPGGSNGNSIYQDVVITRGKGSRVYDANGKQYVDYVMGGGPMMLGHAHPAIVEAVSKQMLLGCSYFGMNEVIIEHAAVLCASVPCAEQVRYCSSGTEATLFALRAARAISGRPKVVKFEGGYHGHNDIALMSLTPDELRPFPTPHSGSLGISKAVEEETLIAPFNDIDTTTAIIEKHKDQIGAVICEPVQRVLDPKPEFLQGLREVCDTLEVPLIFDEIAAGFRISPGGAQELYGVTPDLCCLGKIIAGGFPMAAVAGKTAYMEPFDMDGAMRVPQIGTFNGHPVAAAAGLAMMKTLLADGGMTAAVRHGEQLKAGIECILQAAGVPHQVIGPPTLFDFFISSDEVKDYRGEFHSDRQLKAAIVEGLKRHGVYKVHTDDDLETTLVAFEAALDEAQWCLRVA